jgi:uncharacterized phage-associated protein
MRSAMVDSSFDIAYWFIDRSLNDGEYLQPQKLHRLLYLSQAYFAVASHGRYLMPALFVADDVGPIEPSVMRACEIQRPAIESKILPEIVVNFLEGLWRKYGSHSTEYLNSLIKNHAPYLEAFRKSPRTIISIESMQKFYSIKFTSEPMLERLVHPNKELEQKKQRIMVSQSGKPVVVGKWIPKEKPSL